MDSQDERTALDALTETLWAERHVVELLLYKLVGAKLYLAADERRFVTMALDEVERVVGALRATEARRSATLRGLAAQWGLDPADLTLSELAQRTGEPWRTMFTDHQEGFAALAAEIEETATTNRRLAQAGLGAVRQTLDALAGPPVPTTYGADGRADVSAPMAVRLDQAI